MSEQVYEESIEVDADPQRVWEVLIDVESWPEWTPSMTTVEVIGPRPLRRGSRVATKQPRLPPAEMTVDEYAEGRSFTWSSQTRGLRTIADHRVDPTPTGSRVTLILKQSGPLAGLVRLGYGRLIRRYLHLESTGLKRRAES
jgi:uncharacterized protein YndB with AHSA1/START domain